MSEFIVDTEGSEGIFGVFEDDGKAGYLYIYEPNGRGIIEHLHIYDHDSHTRIRRSDIDVMWSTDHRKCGVSIGGRMRGVIDISGPKAASTSASADDLVNNLQLLNGFDDYFDHLPFLRARQRYWKEILSRSDPKAKPLPESKTPPETNFVAGARRPGKSVFAVFEDDGETGYLYLYDPAQQKILRHLQIYDEELKITPNDVQVVWSNDGSKCGVIIWDKMRGIVDLVKNQEGRVKLENRRSPGIGDAEWLKGFEYKQTEPKRKIKLPSRRKTS